MRIIVTGVMNANEVNHPFPPYMPTLKVGSLSACRPNKLQMTEKDCSETQMSVFLVLNERLFYFSNSVEHYRVEILNKIMNAAAYLSSRVCNSEGNICL